MRPIVKTLTNMLLQTLAGDAPANLWVDERGRLHVTPSGGVAPAPAPATAVSTPASVAVDDEGVALEGECPAGALIRSPLSNTAIVYLGGPDVTAEAGFPLYPGETFEVPDTIVDLALIGAICDTDATAELRVWVAE